MAAKRKINDDDRQLIFDATDEALEKSGGEIKNAVILLEQNVRRCSDLYNAIVESGIKDLCYEAIRLRLMHLRQSIVKQTNTKDRALPSADRGFSDTGLSAVAAINLKSLMNFPVTGGKRLGDCTHAEVAESAQKYYAQGLTMMSRGKWLALIAQSISGNKLVKDVLTEDRLHELQVEADREDR